MERKTRKQYAEDAAARLKKSQIGRQQPTKEKEKSKVKQKPEKRR